MATFARCPRCGARLGAADDVCPSCLLRSALDFASDEAPRGPTVSSDQPERIGPYRLLETLGQGGMGIVYLAEQEEPIRRRVALKVIKVGHDTRQVVARFEAERQTLALMHHPNIAAVFDAGTTKQGRPYFAMEYVPGLPITEYCDQHRLSMRERIGLFVDVCAAVHHAHQKGIIHRDIKPTNILVTEQDDRPVPKVIDFGVAKATGQHLTERSFFTEHGVLIGTPEYMSPEQADGSGAGVDTRADIYALGVVLYELLVGALPFEPQVLRAAGYEEIIRIIRDEEPARPSTKLSSMGATATDVARRRRTDQRALTRELTGDLDWVTLKALEKDRSRRYPSVSELAADLVRHLRTEPVVARPPSAAYRLGRFVRRHRAESAVAAATLASVIAGGTLATVSYLHEREARRETDRRNYVATIRLADLHLRASEHLEATRYLRETNPELRGLEWDYLWRSADASRMSLPASGGVNVFPYLGSSFWFSEHGRQLVSNTQQAITVWDYPEGRRTAVRGGMGRIVAMGPGGGLVLCRRGPVPTMVDPRPRPRLLLLDTVTGQVVTEISEADEQVTAAAFNSAGTHVATGFGDGRISVWTTTGVLVGSSLSRPGAEIDVMAFSPDGRLLAAASRDGPVRIWDLPGIRLVRTFEGAVESVQALRFSPEGRTLVTGDSGGELRVWDLATGETLRKWNAHERFVIGIAFSPDGTLIASTGYNDVVKLWRVDSGTLVEPFGTAAAWFSPDAVVFSPDGREILAAYHYIEFADVVAWPIEGVRPWQPTGSMAPIALSPTSDVIAVADRASEVRLLDLASQTEIGRLDTAGTGATVLSFDGEGARLASGSGDGTVIVWDIVTERPVARLEGHTSRITTVVFAPTNDSLVSGSADGSLRVWSLPDGSELVRATFDDPINTLAIRGGNLVVGTGRESGSTSRMTAHLVDRQTGRVVHSARPFEGMAVSAAAVGPDGRLLFGSSGMSSLAVWDKSLETEQAQFDLGSRVVHCLRFSRDGRRILVGVADGTLILDSQTLDQLLRLDAPGWVEGAAQSASGRFLAAATSREVLVWDTRSFHDPTLPLQTVGAPGQLGPESVRTVRAAGLQERTYQGILQEAERVVSEEPWNPTALNMQALALVRLGRADEALVAIEQAMQHRAFLDPEDLVVVALAYARLGDRTRARQALDDIDRLTQRDDYADPSEDLSKLMAEVGARLDELSDRSR